jgi:hypothetical protein
MPRLLKVALKLSVAVFVFVLAIGLLAQYRHGRIIFTTGVQSLWAIDADKEFISVEWAAHWPVVEPFHGEIRPLAAGSAFPIDHTYAELRAYRSWDWGVLQGGEGPFHVILAGDGGVDWQREAPAEQRRWSPATRIWSLEISYLVPLGFAAIGILVTALLLRYRRRQAAHFRSQHAIAGSQ